MKNVYIYLIAEIASFWVLVWLLCILDTSVLNVSSPNYLPSVFWALPFIIFIFDYLSYKKKLNNLIIKHKLSLKKLDVLYTSHTIHSCLFLGGSVLVFLLSGVDTSRLSDSIFAVTCIMAVQTQIYQSKQINQIWKEVALLVKISQKDPNFDLVKSLEEVNKEIASLV